MRTSPSVTPRSPLAPDGGSEDYLHSRGICWESPGLSGLWTSNIWGETPDCCNPRWGSLLKCVKPLSSSKPALCKFDWLGLNHHHQQSKRAGAGQAHLAEFARLCSLWWETSGLLLVCHIFNIAIIILLPVAEMLHSHKYQRETKCFMVLPTVLLTECTTKAKLFSYRYGPHNEAKQAQRWPPLAMGHFRTGGCKGSFINSLTCISTTADLLPVSDLQKISFFVKKKERH